MTKLLVAMALASVVLAGNAQAGNKFDGLLHQVSNKSCEKACRDKVSVLQIQVRTIVGGQRRTMQDQLQRCQTRLLQDLQLGFRAIDRSVASSSDIR